MAANGKTDLPRGCMLILLGVAIGIALPLVLYVVDRPPRYLRQLPAPPSPVSHLLGVAEVDDYFGWYVADVYVATAAGVNYVWAEDDFFQEPDLSLFTWAVADTVPAEWRHTSCWEKSASRIERQAGPIGECLAVDLTGEWCPAPRVSYAIDGAGGVWLLSEWRACPMFDLWVPMYFTVPGGFILGLVLAVGDEVIGRLRRRQRAAGSRPDALG